MPIAQPVAKDAGRRAAEGTGCATIPSATCTKGEARAITSVAGLLAKGRTAFASQDYLAAIEAFKDATKRAVGLGG